MRMQEPEQWQQSRQDWQEQSAFGTEYQGKYEPAQQQESIEAVAGDVYQEQKIYPQEELSWRGKALGIIMIILSSIGFFPSVAGIVASALVLRYANGQEVLLVAGGLGLVSAILVMLVCIAIFVIAVVALALRASSARRRTGRAGWGTRYR
jgi:MFS family permease